MDSERRVYINLPSLLTNVNELGEHQSIPNLFTIPYNVLLKFSHYIIDYAYNITEFYNLLDECMKQEDSMFITFLKFAISANDEISGNENYLDFNFEIVNFDALRKYHCDEIGILTSTEVVTIDGHTLYSTIPEEHHLSLRESLNDTDYNRIQYALQNLIDSLLFRPNRLIYSTTAFLKACIVIYTLASASQPVEGFCNGDVSSMILSFAIDGLLRSRVLTHWRIVYKEDINNYNNSPIVKIWLMETPKERMAALTNTLKGSAYFNLVKDVNFDEIQAILDKSKITIEGQTYYVHNVDYIKEISKLPSNVKLLEYISSDEFKLPLQTDMQDECIPNTVKQFGNQIKNMDFSNIIVNKNELIP